MGFLQGTWWSLDPADLPDTEGIAVGARLREDEQAGERRRRSGNGDCEEDISDTASERRSATEQSQPNVEHDRQELTHGSGEAGGWPTESRVGGLVDGLADRLGIPEPAAEGEDE